MVTAYNPYDANRAMALPRQQEAYAQQKVNQQVNRPAGPKARPGHLRALAEAKQMRRVRVEPTTEQLREVLAHPNGMRFRKEGSVEWPFDRYTQRRLREGSIRIVENVNAQSKREALPSSGRHAERSRQEEKK
jgi:hypothetical protein